MRDYAEEKKLSIQQMNSTQISITKQKHQLVNCFRIKGRPVGRQDVVVIGKDTFNTRKIPHQKSTSSSDFWQNRQIGPGSIPEILNWLRFCTKIFASLEKVSLMVFMISETESSWNRSWESKWNFTQSIKPCIREVILKLDSKQLRSNQSLQGWDWQFLARNL